MAWAQTYTIGIDYTATATRAGNAVTNRHRAPASRLTRLLANIPNLRAAAFRHSNTEIGVEGACIIATSTTTETTMAALSWNGLDGIAATGRGLLLNANRGVAFEKPIYHAMGWVEIADQKAGGAFLKTLPFVDPDKIAIYGWSYGGYLTLKQLQAEYNAIKKQFEANKGMWPELK